MISVIGNTALNIAFILYLIHYFPQLIHNQKNEKLKNLSLHFHGFLAACYLSDLSYGFGLAMPWQYRLVSIIGSICLMIQHIQLRKIHANTRCYKGYTVSLSVMVLVVFYGITCQLSHSFYISMGYISQISAATFFIPQIIKNQKNHISNALSITYLLLDLCCYFCDIIAAFSLNWPTPSKIGALINLMAISILLAQRLTFKKNSPIFLTLT